MTMKLRNQLSRVFQSVIIVVVVLAGFSVVVSQTKPAPRRPAPVRNRAIANIVREIDARNIEATIRKLVSFGTRNTLSEQNDPKRGIGAARDWLYAEFLKAAAASNGRSANRRSWGWWSPWEHTEMRDDRVLYFARTLGRGSWDISYVARATTAGVFVRPPAQAEEMYNPAVHGRSDGGWFTVTEAPERKGS